MTPKRLSSFPHASANGSALAARTLRAEPDPEAPARVEGVVERCNRYGYHADPVTFHEWQFLTVRLWV